MEYNKRIPKKVIDRFIEQRYADSSSINKKLSKMFFDPIEFIKLLAKRGIFVDQQNAWKYFRKRIGEENKSE